jgi:hypothetical protein
VRLAHESKDGAPILFENAETQPPLLLVVKDAASLFSEEAEGLGSYVMVTHAL